MSSFQPSDTELLARSRAGDTAAFDELYRRHVDDARRVARIVSEGADEAEEITAEAFTRILAQLRRGRGPQGELRPYLRTVVRRLAVDRYRSGVRGVVPADSDFVESLPALDDPIMIATNRDMMRKAYETLPPRWQEVLWRTEVEGHSPATLAAQLGSTPNAVAALAYRAREGLRQAYLSMHVASSMRAGCQPYVTMITALTRGTLTPGEESTVNAHIADCLDCRERRDEMLVLVSDLRGVLVPALLGTALFAVPATAGLAAGSAAGGLSAAAGGAAIGAGVGGAGVGGAVSKARHIRPRGSGLAGLAGAAAAVVAATVAAVAMMSSVLGSSPDLRVSDPPLAASVPFDEPTTGDPTTGEPTTAEPTPTPEPTPDEGFAEPEIADPATAADEQSSVTTDGPAPAEPAPSEPVAVPTRDPEPSPDEPSASAPADREQPPPTTEPDPPPSTDSNPDPSPESPETAPAGGGSVAGGEVTPDPGPESRPEPPPEPPESSAPPPPSAAPPSSELPPWLCRLIPTWPGCPDEPERPVHDAVCSRMPDLAWCG